MLTSKLRNANGWEKKEKKSHQLNFVEFLQDILFLIKDLFAQ